MIGIKTDAHMGSSTIDGEIKGGISHIEFGLGYVRAGAAYTLQ